MSLGRVLYGLATRSLGLALPLLLSARVRSGKEDTARLNERRARALPPRPPGRLVWLHGASVGESMVLLGLAERLLDRDDISVLMTSQTLTSANMLATRLPDRTFHQMAPIDTPAIAQRFIRHWRPDLVVFAEGEIWPNLLREAAQSGAGMALVNARMTEKSREGWARWPGFARTVFARFDVILAADIGTAGALESLSGKPVGLPGNLKAALPPPLASTEELDMLKASFLAERPCLLAASTHPGEESVFLDAVETLSPRPALILAPRHPERADAIMTDLAARGLKTARRSKGDTPTGETDILLADTIGEMGLWYRLADAVFLGGATAEGIGGHNPIEPLQLGKRVITGPHGFNFSEVFPELEAAGALCIANDRNALRTLVEAELSGTAAPIDKVRLDGFFARAARPMDETLATLRTLLLPETTE
ncbi:MAG: 3-deoxy-D-manno-octulosonic acid transferase [Hyphomonadaceae bacterium]|nr:3-deoxy-D-manno-octulosonic acid transferase [Hyphomonadaceae bacterium]